MGPHSHLPHSPSLVFSRRFGDCKDKSLLLVTVLNALNIEAWPALVNTEARHMLDEYQPTPLAFNHVIVQAKIGNRVYWVDPTISLQRGSIERLYNPEYKRALVVREGNKDLEEIAPEAPQHNRTEVNETYTALRFDEPALLEVATIYYGKDADEMRAAIAEQALEELGKSYLNFYSRTDSRITSDGLPKIADDQAKNVLIVTENYHIPGFWNDRSRRFISGAINRKLARPSVSRRSMPLAIPYQLSITDTIQVHLPRGVFYPDVGSGRIENTFIQLHYHREFNGDKLKLQYHLQTLKDSVPVDQVADYLRKLDDMRDAIEFEISPKAPDAKASFDVKDLLGVLLPAGLVYGAIITMKRCFSRNRRFIRAAKAASSVPGESPETAIHFAVESEVEKHLQRKKCTCGSVFHANDQVFPRESATFDGQRLTIVHLKCDKCAKTHAIYFELGDQARVTAADSSVSD